VNWFFTYQKSGSAHPGRNFLCHFRRVLPPKIGFQPANPKKAPAIIFTLKKFLFAKPALY
jgi:hypothetical protein